MSLEQKNVSAAVGRIAIRKSRFARAGLTQCDHHTNLGVVVALPTLGGESGLMRLVGRTWLAGGRKGGRQSGETLKERFGFGFAAKKVIAALRRATSLSQAAAIEIKRQRTAAASAWILSPDPPPPSSSQIQPTTARRAVSRRSPTSTKENRVAGRAFVDNSRLLIQRGAY